jgi:hypothetical protein
MAYISQEMKKKLAPAIKAVLKKYDMKGSIAIDNHSSLVVNVKSGKIDFGSDRIQGHPYNIESNYHGVARRFMEEIFVAMRGDIWYDNSDSMTDYFDTAYYLRVNIGQWNKPYEVTK